DEPDQPAVNKPVVLARFVDCELKLIVSYFHFYSEDGYFYDSL
ncbi:MAG: hypothetical protein ACJA2Q_001733, partial [Pseudohongiellaceae bacterium]